MKKLLLITVGATAMLTFSVDTASALRVSRQALIEIVNPAALTQTAAFLLRDIQKPAKGKSYEITVYPEGLIQGLRSDGAGIGEPGAYRLTGAYKESMQLEVQGKSNTQGISFVRVLSEYDGRAGGDAIPSQVAPGKGKTLKLGATLKISGEVASGVHRPSFDIAVSYE